MSRPWMLIAHEVDLIRNFLDHVQADTEAEIRSVLESAGVEDLEPDDLSNLVEPPLARAEIGARAALYELWALVENEVQGLAMDPWASDPKSKGPKSLLELEHVDEESLSSVRSVADLPFRKLVVLLERRFGMSMEQIENWNSILQLREKVSAFKHRKGRKRWSEISFQESQLLPSYTSELSESRNLLPEVLAAILAMRRVAKLEAHGEDGPS